MKTTLEHLVDFYREATFDDFDRMMEKVVPHTGREYRLGKFKAFQESPVKWMCSLETNRLKKLNHYLNNQ